MATMAMMLLILATAPVMNTKTTVVTGSDVVHIG